MANSGLLEERWSSGNRWPASLGFFLINRFQIVYYIIILPRVLAYPPMIGVIVAAALLSHINLRILGKWMETQEAELGHAGFVRLLGSASVRLLAGIGVAVMLLNCTIVTLGYISIVHQVLFPSMDQQVLAVLLCLASCYLASHGMYVTGRFAIIALTGSVWIIAVYVQFFIPPLADYTHLFPIVPQEVPQHVPEKLLTVWAALSGPEYLAFAGKRFASSSGLFRWFAWGNALTAVEYALFFVASLLFFGEHYLQKIDLPIVQMIRYIQLPFFERLEMIILSAYMISFVLLNAFFILYVHDAARVAFNLVNKTKSRLGILGAAALLAGFMYLFGACFWETENDAKQWTTIRTWIAGISYAVIPSFLAAATYVTKKRRDRRAG